MRRLIPLIAFAVAIPAFGQSQEELRLAAARERWVRAGIQNYSFVYENRNDNIVPRSCFPDAVRIVVRNGHRVRAVVIRGGGSCPSGSSLPKSERGAHPANFEDLFAIVDRVVRLPVGVARTQVAYDPVYGFPTALTSLKLQTWDNDEGFTVTEFKVTK